MFSRSKVLGVLAGGAAALSFSFGITAEARANNLYVATDGSAYYYSINDAVAAASSGDTIQVAPGTYYGVVKVQGKSNLTIKGQPNAAKPVITLTASPYDYDLVIIEGSHHITFTGFELNGRETLDGNGNVTNVGAGIETNGLKIIPIKAGSNAVSSHHITIDNLTVHHLGGGGIISYIDTDYPSVGNDYITIQSCEIYNTNQTSQYRGSAISLLGNVKYDNNSGAHCFVQNNRIHDNVNRNKDTIVNEKGETVIDPFKHSDGNGIIIDTQLSTGPSTVIQSNLVYRNGGRGIHIFDSGNVSVLNNTTYYNCLDPYLQDHPGELTAGAAQNVLFSNNIAYIGYVQVAPGRETPVAFRAYNYSGGPANSNILFKNNTFANGSPTPDWNSNADDKYSSNDAMDWNTTIFHDPSWGNLFYNAANGDFRLNTLQNHAQTARNRGSNAAGEFAWYDFTWTINRTVNPIPGGAVDRGAYEQ